MEDLQRNQANLLTLPRCDVGLSMPKDSPCSSYPSLLLLQLPPKWQAADLKDARFVIPDQQASLVVEGRQVSFVLQRVETSNALVLVPPVEKDDHDTAASNHNNEEQPQESPAKRRKVTNTGVTLQAVQARLLHQGTGAFFLEAKTEPLRLADLQAQLPVWDPTDESETKVRTISISSLSNALAKSEAEIVQGLHEIQAVAWSNDGNDDGGYYCRLAEEARLDVLDTVLATLTEAFPHYIAEGIPVNDFLTSARVRLPRVLQASPDVAHTLTLHCLQTLTTTTHKVKPHHKKALSLDVTRVGATVASRILTRQPIWPESDFMETWQAEMPGVDCQVATEWLRGHAVRLSQETADDDADNNTPTTPTAATTTTYYWKYLPTSAVVDTPHASVVWERLVQAKPQWTAAALEPYLEAWKRFTGQVPASVLCQAAVRTEGDLKIYHAR